MVVLVHVSRIVEQFIPGSPNLPIIDAQSTALLFVILYTAFTLKVGSFSLVDHDFITDAVTIANRGSIAL